MVQLEKIQLFLGPPSCEQLKQITKKIMIWRGECWWEETEIKKALDGIFNKREYLN